MSLYIRSPDSETAYDIYKEPVCTSQPACTQGKVDRMSPHGELFMYISHGNGSEYLLKIARPRFLSRGLQPISILDMSASSL